MTLLALCLFLSLLGGGTFVSRSGHVQHFAKGGVTGARGEMGDRRVGKVTIPEGALPSEEMLERQLEAVTISESKMVAWATAIEKVSSRMEGKGGR